MADDLQRCAVLYPAVAEAARRIGAERIGLIDIGGPATNVDLDRIGITFSDGVVLGDPAATAQLSCRIIGAGTVPAAPLPDVVSRLGIDHREFERLPEVIDLVPEDALPVITTTWTLPKLSLKRRPVFFQVLASASIDRSIAWVSIEGVGVAPEVSTFGDRPASGHSIIGVAVFDHGEHRIESVGRCWQRGAVMSWLI